MSATKRIRNEISIIQERIRSLGNTNRNRWSTFCLTNKMTKQEFEDRLMFYGIEINPADKDEIWSIMEPTGETISMSNFIKIIQVDAFSYVPHLSNEQSAIYSGRMYNSPEREPAREEPVPDFNANEVEPPKGEGRVSETSAAIFNNLHEIILQCLDLDRKKRAEISLRSFTSICSDVGVNSYGDEWREFIHKFDPYASGLVPYFLVADTVCKDNELNEMPNQDALPPLYDHNEAPQEDKRYNYDNDVQSSKNDGFYDESPASHRNDYYEEKPPLKMPQNDDYYNEQPQGRKPFDDDYYDEQPLSQRSRQSNLYADQSPSARSRHSNYYDEPNMQFSNSGSSGRHEVFEPGQQRPPVDKSALLKLIANKVDENMGSTSNAFNKWRGFDSKLTAVNLRNGLERDAHINVPLEDVESIMANYGGDLSPAGFSRMLGEGSALSSARKMTQDDQALQDIADQIHQDGWEKIFFRASSAGEMARLLSEMGVVVDEADVRRLTMKLGRTGVIDALNLRVHY